jgi:predicted nucleic acid-binding protein
MIVICDASPLIFLAKLGRLELIRLWAPGEVVILKCVVEEVLGERGSPKEKELLAGFIEEARVVDFEESAYESKALSPSDRKTLTYAVRQQADWLVADERALRRIAGEQGVPTVGILGLLAAAVRRGELSPAEARADLGRAVSELGFRISSHLYRQILAEFDR